jgi:hypothetical protein
MFAVTRFSFLAVALMAGSAQAMDSNFHIAFPLGFNQVSSEEVQIVQNPPTEMDVPGGFRGGLRLGVNIKGYVGIEFNVDAQGWDLFKEERGGLGFVGGALRLHPVQIAQHWKPELKTRDWDISMAYGTGWHLLGQQADGGWGRAYEGSYHQFELAFEYYVTEIFTVALELPWRNPVYDPHVFSNYEEGTGFCYDDGVWLGLRGSVAGTCEGKTAPQASIFSPAISLNFRIPLTRSAKRRRSPAREY